MSLISTLHKAKDKTKTNFPWIIFVVSLLLFVVPDYMKERPRSTTVIAKIATHKDDERRSFLVLRDEELKKVFEIEVSNQKFDQLKLNDHLLILLRLDDVAPEVWKKIAFFFFPSVLFIASVWMLGRRLADRFFAKHELNGVNPS